MPPARHACMQVMNRFVRPSSWYRRSSSGVKPLGRLHPPPLEFATPRSLLVRISPTVPCELLMVKLAVVIRKRIGSPRSTTTTARRRRRKRRSPRPRNRSTTSTSTSSSPMIPRRLSPAHARPQRRRGLVPHSPRMILLHTRRLAQPAPLKPLIRIAGDGKRGPRNAGVAVGGQAQLDQPVKVVEHLGVAQHREAPVVVDAALQLGVGLGDLRAQRRERCWMQRRRARVLHEDGVEGERGEVGVVCGFAP